MAVRAGVWLIWLGVAVIAIGMTIVCGLVGAFLLANLPPELIWPALVTLVVVIAAEEMAAHRA